MLENSNANALWWDGYAGEGRLIIDDFYGWIQHHVLLRVLDVYPMRLDIKGSTTYAAWTEVFITSNKHPREWFNKYPWDADDALQRRIHHIWEVRRTLGGFIWECALTNQRKDFDNNFLLVEN